jgi:hypothetical protein
MLKVIFKERERGRGRGRGRDSFHTTVNSQ